MYYIDIIDTTSPLVRILPKSASSKGIVLEWNGGDSKDDLLIVGSNLKFDMLSVDDSDGAFIDYFTGDEHRFKTQIKNSVDDSIIWQGHILPDLYAEPYKAVNFFVSFTATDGLGRLKGKYLLDEYYSQEKAVTDILCQILRLTGLDLELYFAPAIENFIEKNWNKIYIDTENFMESNKKLDAYKILETILNDTLCVCYQCDNRWYIEGINVRHLRNMVYRKYDAVGNYVGTVNFDRVTKQITALVTPSITMIPPYNEVVISHKKKEPNFPKTLSKEANDGWAVVTGVVGKIYATDWMANGGLYAKCFAPDYYCTVANKSQETGSTVTNYAQDDTQFVSLKKKLFFFPGQRAKISFDFRIVNPTANSETPSNLMLWENPFKYEFLFNDAVIYSNFGGTVLDAEKVIFNSSGEAKLAIDHIFTEEGLFDVKIYGPPGETNTTKIKSIAITAAAIEVIGFVEEQIETDLINGDFTIDKKIELDYADDKAGFSKGFRLAKLKEETTFFNEIEIPILYGFTFEGKYYSQVQLDGANLIADNKYQVYYEGSRIRIKDVVYNWYQAGDMLIETENPITSGSFTVKKYAISDVVASREHWTQWTDAFYKIENTTYVKTVANIYRRMFNVAHEKLDVTAKNAVKFNDIIQFKYTFLKDFVVLNCSCNLDSNTSELTLGRSNYKDSTGTNPTDANIPPIVVAGNDIYISDTQTTATLLATAYDPDGFIASQVWTKTVGGAGDVIATPTLLGTELSNLTDDLYTYQIQVTDNDGATAVDTINIIRAKEYTISLDLFTETVNAQEPQILVRKYKVNVTPALPSNFILNFKGVFHVYAQVGIRNPYAHSGEPRYQSAQSWYIIEKNGAVFQGDTYKSLKLGDIKDETINIDVNIISTDEIYITTGAYLSFKEVNYPYYTNAKSDTNFKLQSAFILSGAGTIVGPPIEVEVLLKNY